MKSWCFHRHYKPNSLGTNEISYNIFNLRHMSKVAGHFPKKNKMEKYYKKDSANIRLDEDVFRLRLQKTS